MNRFTVQFYYSFQDFQSPATKSREQGPRELPTGNRLVLWNRSVPHRPHACTIVLELQKHDVLPCGATRENKHKVPSRAPGISLVLGEDEAGNMVRANPPCQT